MVLISSYPNSGNGMCIDAPLGNGGCPNDDTNPPVLLHVDQQVASINGLQITLDRWGDWSG